MTEQTRMDPEIKARWVAWLRANVDKQGEGRLRSHDDKYCCLGGLCELAVAAGVVRAERTDDIRNSDVHHSMSYYDPHNSGDRNRTTLPWAVAQWAGLSVDDPAVRLDENRFDLDKAGLHSLSAVNDNGWGDFNVIADLIEAQL